MAIRTENLNRNVIANICNVTGDYQYSLGGKIKSSHLHGAKGYKGNEIKLIHFTKVF